MSLVKTVSKTFQLNFFNNFKLRSPFYGSRHFVLASITTTLSCKTNYFSTFAASCYTGFGWEKNAEFFVGMLALI